jgi:hypothetical protein
MRCIVTLNERRNSSAQKLELAMITLAEKNESVCSVRHGTY